MASKATTAPADLEELPPIETTLEGEAGQVLSLIHISEPTRH